MAHQHRTFFRPSSWRILDQGTVAVCKVHNYFAIIHSFIHSFIHSSIHLSICLFIYFIYLFVYFLSYLFVCLRDLFITVGCNLLLQNSSVPCSSCYSRRSTNSHHHLPRPRHTTHGQEERNRQKAPVCGNTWLHISDLLGQDWHTHHKYDVRSSGEYTVLTFYFWHFVNGMSTVVHVTNQGIVIRKITHQRGWN